MARARAPLTGVACPFCGLGCDDLAIGRADDRAWLEGPECPLARAEFERSGVEETPRVDGRSATLEAAIDAAATLIGSARSLAVGGLGTDVAGVREALALAEAMGGTYDHFRSAGLFRNIRVLQDGGWIVTTLSEVMNRADLVIAVGEDPRERFPRFVERCLSPDPAYAAPGTKRRLIAIGRPPAAALPDHIDASHLAVAPGDLGAALACLRLAVAGQPVPGPIPAGLDGARLGALASEVKAARYGVIVWNAAALDMGQGELVVQAAVDLVKALNLVTRFACLPLAGHDGLIGANQVSLWQAGVPLRTSFADGAPDFDPVLYETARRVKAGEADTLLWISSFTPEPPPMGPPTVALVRPGTRFAAEPKVVIPVATPGVEAAGAVFRTDAVIALKLRAIRESALPGVAEVIAALRARLSARAAGATP